MREMARVRAGAGAREGVWVREAAHRWDGMKIGRAHV